MVNKFPFIGELDGAERQNLMKDNMERSERLHAIRKIFARRKSMLPVSAASNTIIYVVIVFITARMLRKVLRQTGIWRACKCAGENLRHNDPVCWISFSLSFRFAIL